MSKLALAAAAALLLAATAPAFAEGGWSSSQMSSRNGDRNEGQSGGSNLGSPWGLLDDLARRLGLRADRDPRKFESSSQRDRDPFNSPDIGAADDGMTSRDAGY